MGSIGYARVSTLDQDADLQHAALTAGGCDRIFTDHGVSGTTAGRLELDKLLDHLRNGDEVVVWKLDRLGRNPRNLLPSSMTWSIGASAFAASEGVSTTGPMGRVMLTVMSAFAQLECDQLAERTRAGMAGAAEHGRRAGRRKIDGASRATVYRYLSMGITDAS